MSLNCPPLRAAKAIFIPFDIVCLTLQVAGGAISTQERNRGHNGVSISQAGVGLQVVVIFVFMVAFADYMIRLAHSGRLRGELTSWRCNISFSGLIVASMLILTRCAFRVAELKNGYRGKLFREEIPFIILEGVMIVLAGITLMFSHPGLFLDRPLSVDHNGCSGVVSIKHDHPGSDDVILSLG